MNIDNFSKRFLLVLRIKQVVGIILFVVACIMTYVILVTDIPNAYLMSSIMAMGFLPVYVLSVMHIRKAIIKHFERKVKENEQENDASPSQGF